MGTKYKILKLNIRLFLNSIISSIYNSTTYIHVWYIIIYNIIISTPIFEILFALCCISIKIFFVLNVNEYLFLIHSLAVHDTGNMFALLLYLEHVFISYYLIIILVMVYWSLYSIILDFLGWSITYDSFIFIFSYIIISKIIVNINLLYINIKGKILKIFLLIKELEFIFYLNDEIINIENNKEVKDKNNYIKYEIESNNKNLFQDNKKFKHYDILGRSVLLINYSALKYLLAINILIEMIIIERKIDLYGFFVKRKLSNYLFYRTADAYYYSNTNEINLYLKKSDYVQLNYSNKIYELRTIYKEMFLINQFKHSGIFEAIWAIIPSCIILIILIPSLILLYSFENILNPGLTIKVIGNQWYWKYEFNNYISEKTIENDQTKVIHSRLVNYCFDSKIIDTDNLKFGTKRLLEVDNRLVLPTNVTIRFLVSSTDVLHSFSMPGLGFKIDANPGRLNQIIAYINRPGVYYGQCSELCGANHGFMPIVIQSVPPSVYLEYINNILENSE